MVATEGSLNIQLYAGNQNRVFFMYDVRCTMLDVRCTPALILKTLHFIGVSYI